MVPKMYRPLGSFTFLLFFLVIQGMGVQDIPGYKEVYYEQNLDHFSFNPGPAGVTSFKQRYLVQDKWWTKGKGPIFFYTGNEGAIDNFWNNTGFVFEQAPAFNALVIFAEHRYYGKSLPFGPVKSFKPPYIGYLTIEQALADFAQLITHLKETYGAQDCPVISFGGSYGGMLTAYLRIKYPHVVDGGLAGSAPIYLSPKVRDFFFQDVTKDFNDADPRCVGRVRDGFSKMQHLASQGSSGLAQISKYFKSCKVLKTDAEYRHLVGWLRNAFTILAMMDYPYPTDFLGKLPAYPVKASCKIMQNAADPIVGLVAVGELYYGTPKCHDLWAEFVECADPTGCGVGNDGAAWDFQACTELVMPSGTTNVTDMFPVLPFTMAERKAYCMKRWGVTPRDDWIHIYIGDNDLRTSSNIIFSNGNLDPWHRGGVLKSLSDNLVALPVPGGAHHLDLRSSNPADPPAVTEARKQEVNYITKWVAEARKGQ